MADKVGRYEIRKELGRGGMATVYLAFDPRIRRQVAIKVLPRQFTHDPKYLARFQQEAQMIATLEHPAIVPIHDFGEHEDAPYLVMRYMSGGTLADRLKGGPLSLEEIAGALGRVALALDYAHEVGVIHRDLKPANILFDHQGNPYLADFGIARLAEASQTMTMIGTPAYVSPEQVEGDQELDGRADIYALGVVLYELFAGQQPYTADTPFKLTMAHVLKPVPNVLEANPQLPPEAQKVIKKALAKDREERYQSAAELATAVHALLASKTTTAEDAAVEAVLVPTAIETKEAAPGPAAEDLSDTEIGEGEVEVEALADANVPPQNAALGDTWVRQSDGMAMVYIPQGSFPMGSAEWGNEKPVHDVSLDGFWIDRTVVTNAQFAKFVAATGHETTAEREGSSDAYIAGRRKDTKGANWRHPLGRGSDLDDLEDHPVVHVSWFDAEAYCEWAGTRLPTEAEWEYAARGPEGNEYPWGAEAPDCDLAQFHDCDGRTVPATSLPNGESWIGARNMSGNVWEWVNDWYRKTYQANSPERNPQGPKRGSFKVLRGGSWLSSVIALRGADRNYASPDSRYDSFGFRCVVSPGN